MTEALRRRRALLVGCGTFTDSSLAQLRSPRRDVEELGRVLQEVGYSQVSAEIDCNARDAQRAVEAFLSQARVDDAMNIIYFSSHGLPDRRGKLYFAFSDTEKQYLSATAVAAEWVRDRIYESRSKSTVVLVDCCFSGGFIAGMQARSSAEADVEVLVRGLPEGSGVAVLTASGERETSFEDVDSSVVRPSYFTEAVVVGIGTGAADLNRDSRITVDELYEYVYHHVVSGPSPQRPRKLGMGEGSMVVAERTILPVPVAQAELPLEACAPVLQARGVLGYAAFDGQWVVIGKDGIGHVLKGERRLHVSQLAGVAFKPATTLNYGYLQVIQKGVQPIPISRFGPNAGRPPMDDGASVSFARAVNDEMQQIREAIEAAIGGPQGGVRTPPHKKPAWASLGRGLLWALGFVAALLEVIVVAATVTESWDSQSAGTAIAANLLSGFAVFAVGRVLYVNHRR
ncbi:caspase family protein [Micromonospora sp. WMMD1082]|uniref:caspase, EACC1-associated type n=1 Tax=Micromonospora sp. WMMD1082 TaxID=3016104 RepID=UPI002417AF2D|nr:caspase family protein [Micromonospora sp. WMMD1082]MDG4795472.1 caspase family protein [Micromonospora sp. WMMD1082]